MTENQAQSLKPGDKLLDIKENKEITLAGFTLGDFKGTTFIHIAETQLNGNSLWLLYFLDEIDLLDDNKPHLCRCGKLDVIFYGCKCKGN